MLKIIHHVRGGLQSEILIAGLNFCCMPDNCWSTTFVPPKEKPEWLTGAEERNSHKVKREMHRYKRGKAKGGKGGKVKNRKQAIAVQGAQERKASSPKEALR